MQKGKARVQANARKGQNEETPLQIQKEPEHRASHDQHSQEQSKRIFKHNVSSMDMRTYFNQKCKRDKWKTVAEKMPNEVELVVDQVVSKKKWKIEFKSLRRSYSSRKNKISSMGKISQIDSCSH